MGHHEFCIEKAGGGQAVDWILGLVRVYLSFGFVGERGKGEGGYGRGQYLVRTDEEEGYCQGDEGELRYKGLMRVCWYVGDVVRRGLERSGDLGVGFWEKKLVGFWGGGKGVVKIFGILYSSEAC